MEFKEMIDFKGKIHFKCQIILPTGKIIVLKEWTTENLITNNGRTLLITRVGNNTPDPISHIALGTGSTPAAFTDTALVSEKARVPAGKTVQGTPSWTCVFTGTFTSTQINDTREIGLLNASTGGTLCTRTVLPTAITGMPEGSDISVDYRVGLLSSTVTTGWVKTSGYTNVYEVARSGSLPVTGVQELDTSTGYAKRTSIGGVDTEASTYYHDTTAGKLYIRPSTGVPADHRIIVQSGG